MEKVPQSRQEHPWAPYPLLALWCAYFHHFSSLSCYWLDYNQGNLALACLTRALLTMLYSQVKRCLNCLHTSLTYWTFQGLSQPRLHYSSASPIASWVSVYTARHPRDSSRTTFASFTERVFSWPTSSGPRWNGLGSALTTLCSFLAS